jgi:hypothetical protein
MKGYAEFEFDLREALLGKLISTFDAMENAGLTLSVARSLPEAQGVYQILLDNRVIYIGKTDAEAGLRDRLQRHARKILHRRGLDPGRVTFRALRIFVFTPMELEADMIAHYGARSVSWNGSGFGSNDPGRRRDATELKASHFDILYPIDLDRPLDLPTEDAISAADAFRVLKSSVPYLIRFESIGKTSHGDLESAKVKLTKDTTARRAIIEIFAELASGWQATALPGHVIIYKEARSYTHGAVIARS